MDIPLADFMEVERAAEVSCVSRFFIRFSWIPGLQI